MSLVTVTNLKALTDALGAIYLQLRPVVGLTASSAVAGTSRFLAEEARDVIVADSDDAEQQLDMNTALGELATNMNIEDVCTEFLGASLTTIENHIRKRGSSVASSIISLSTFLSYYNGGSGGVLFSSMLTPDFGDLWYAVKAARLPVAGILSPAIAPVNGNANGMGTRAVGGSFTDGAAVNTTLHSAVTLAAEITVDFAAGGTPPAVTVAGTDHLDGTSVTWSGTFTGNNPVAAVSTTTTEAITAQARQVITLASGTGIVAGSILVVNSGLEDEETVIVESINTADITAVFTKAHDSGAAVTGNTTIALTPSTGGRRCKNVSGITITIDTHTDGTVRIIGVQDRVGI